ncbi:putative ras-related protein rab-18 [Pisolithus marmoratus]|nr:putative ras-related protein rab-18 [Pisolithus marmoratus]
MTRSPPLEFKIVVIGNSSVGKTSLYRRSFDKESSLDVAATCGTDFHSECMQVDGRQVKLGIWDTAGMERFRSITRPFYRDAQGVILVYNITDRTSFDALPGWLAEINRYAPPTTSKIIVGNKLDQEHSREVSTFDGESFAATNGALFREASAKTLVGVTEVFEDLVKEMLDAEDRAGSADIPRRQEEIIKLSAKDQPKRRWRNNCRC